MRPVFLTRAWRRPRPQVAPAPRRKVGGAGGNSDAETGWRAVGDNPDRGGVQELRQRSPKLCDDSDPSRKNVLLNATVKNRLEKLCEPVEPPQSFAPLVPACPQEISDALPGACADALAHVFTHVGLLCVTCSYEEKPESKKGPTAPALTDLRDLWSVGAAEQPAAARQPSARRCCSLMVSLSGPRGGAKALD